MIKVVYAASWLARRRFYWFSHELYRKDPNWREPAAWGGFGVLSPARNEMMRLPHVLLMAADEKNRIKARVLAGVNGDKGFFAMFDARNHPEAVKRLIQEMLVWLRAHGAKTVEGPVAPVPVDLGGGVLAEGFDGPAAWNDAFNAPYYTQLLEEYEFEVMEEYLAYRVSPRWLDAEKYERAARKICGRFGLTVDLQAVSRPRELTKAVCEVMGEQDGEEAIRRMIGRMLPDLCAPLCPVVYAKNEAAGFLLTMRRQGGTPRVVTLWVHEKWRRKGITAVLFSEVEKAMKKMKVESADASFVNGMNKASVMGIELAGGRAVRRYFRYSRKV